MHHGTTVVHWDGSNSQSAICFLRLENDNGTLSWCKPQWSALRGVSMSTPDYSFRANFETQGMVNKYSAGLQIDDMLEEGKLVRFLILR